MVEHELAQGAPHVARKLLRQHDDPPAELSARVNAAVERLEALERDADPRRGIRQRARRAVLAGFGWIIFCGSCGALTRSGVFVIDHLRFAMLGCTFIAGSAIELYLSRHEERTSTNRRLMQLGFLVFVSSVFLWPLMGALGLSMPQSTVLGAFVAGVVWTSGVSFVGKSWLPFSLGHFSVAGLAWLFPPYHFEIFGLLAIPIFVTAWWMWHDAQRPVRSLPARVGV